MRDQLLQRGVLQSKAAIEDAAMANEAAFKAELPLEHVQEPQQLRGGACPSSSSTTVGALSLRSVATHMSQSYANDI